jgi:predicted DNA-binding protein (MmcQ/YjbR family)
MTPPDARSKRYEAALREFALRFPETREDFPWGESVVKVGEKVFLFLGTNQKGVHASVKLPASGMLALALPFTEPSRYGLGKHGWITAHLEPDDLPPVGLLYEWIEESFRAVAPKRLVARLGSPATPPGRGGRTGGRAGGRASGRARGATDRTPPRTRRATPKSGSPARARAKPAGSGAGRKNAKNQRKGGGRR